MFCFAIQGVKITYNVNFYITKYGEVQWVSTSEQFLKQHRSDDANVQCEQALAICARTRIKLLQAEDKRVKICHMLHSGPYHGTVRSKSVEY